MKAMKNIIILLALLIFFSQCKQHSQKEENESFKKIKINCDKLLLIDTLYLNKNKYKLIQVYEEYQQYYVFVENLKNNLKYEIIFYCSKSDKQKFNYAEIDRRFKMDLETKGFFNNTYSTNVLLNYSRDSLKSKYEIVSIYNHSETYFKHVESYNYDNRLDIVFSCYTNLKGIIELNPDSDIQKIKSAIIIKSILNKH